MNTTNLYWPVYKSIEREVLAIADVIHIDDKQLNVYSVKIAELLIRTCVEVESIAKELYKREGGSPAETGKFLYYDSGCLKHLDSKWSLSTKVVLVSSANLYLAEEPNQILKPMLNAPKGKAPWQKAYQAVKHDRARSLKKGNIGFLLKALAGLFLLNVYYRNSEYDIKSDSVGDTFDQSLGSDLFAIEIYRVSPFSKDGKQSQESNFDYSSYLIEPQENNLKEARKAWNDFNDKIKEDYLSILSSEGNRRLDAYRASQKNGEPFDLEAFMAPIKLQSAKRVGPRHGPIVLQAIQKLKYKAVLNTNQYGTDKSDKNVEPITDAEGLE